jgi:hypothetical protein
MPLLTTLMTAYKLLIFLFGTWLSRLTTAQLPV